MNTQVSQAEAVNNALLFGAAIVVFIKSNGTKRVMLCTRNTVIAATVGSGEWSKALYSRDARNGAQNASSDTINVVDIVKGEPRSFKLSTVLLMEDAGDIRDAMKFKAALARVKELEQQVAEGKFSVSFDNL